MSLANTHNSKLIVIRRQVLRLECQPRMAMFVVNAKGKKDSAVSVAVATVRQALDKSKELTDAGFTEIIVLDSRGREVSATQLSAVSAT